MKNLLCNLSSVLCANVLVLGFAIAFTASADEAGAIAVPNADAPIAHHSSPPFVAVVNRTVISSAEFEAAASEAARQKFYHGTPPQGAVEELLREVANRMIDRLLVLEEAKRLELKADTDAVDERIAQYEARYAAAERWQRERDVILPLLRERLEEDSLLDAVEAKVRSLPPPAESEVRAYYSKYPEKFTEPEKMQLSIIVLQVDPSSTTAVWEAAESEAGALIKRLEAGAEFAELARLHSAHESAAQGGNLGYLHRGMLPDGIQEQIDSMKPGDLSPPTRILQGFAIFRYEAIQPSIHHDFDTVRDRAADLLIRERSEDAWEDFIAGLRSAARIEVNTQRYPALAVQADSTR